MKPFIKLTTCEDNSKIYLNTDHIVAIFSCGDITKVVMSKNSFPYEVKESVEEITKHLSILRIEKANANEQ